MQPQVYLHPTPFILSLLLLTCAYQQAPPPLLPGQPEQELSESERFDIAITSLLISPVKRTQLRNSSDPVGWLEYHWERNDPDPTTTENEALEVFRQRARFLMSRFPDLHLSDVPEPWLSLFKFGHWDWIQSGYMPYRLRIVDAISSQYTTTRYTTGHVTDVLHYRTPEPHDVLLSEHRLMRGLEIPKVPSLRRVWEVLENPVAKSERKAAALSTIAWFEIPSVPRRLLSIPDSTLLDVRSELDACYRTMAVRRAYCLGIEGARRLAAITAAGASPRVQLQRTLDDVYPRERYLIDLEVLLEDRERTPPFGYLGPHPSLAKEPEAFLDELADRFPSEKSLTGWDWRGDLYLAFGPPLHINDNGYSVIYLYGYPMSVAIRSGVLGAVGTGPYQDMTAAYIDNHHQTMLNRRAEVQRAINRLKAAIPEASAATDSLLSQLYRVLPPKAQRVGLLAAEKALYMTADAVVFPDSTGSVDIMASIGIPFTEISIERAGTGLGTNLVTSCQLLSAAQHTISSDRHDGGFSIEIPDRSTETLYLVDTFRYRAEPGDYYLYFSVLDPDTEKSAGMLLPLDLQTDATTGPVISPIALAGRVSEDETDSGFARGNHRILPYPGRNLLYGEDIWIYFEINNLERSEFGDYAWEESYYFIPDQVNMGIVRTSSGEIHNSLKSHNARYIMIDLSEREKTYSGPTYIVVLIRDAVSGRSVLAAARFDIGPPPG